MSGQWACDDPDPDDLAVLLLLGAPSTDRALAGWGLGGCAALSLANAYGVSGAKP